jgi:predicted lipoprotein with Yx(FWY)xxD motif
MIAAMSGQALAASHPKGVEISTVKTSLGRVLSSSSGHVMFRFMKDPKNLSKCGSTCRAIWPPVTSKAKARAGTGVSKAHLGLTKKGQVTYYGHPLYYYIGDPARAKTRGDGTLAFGARWYVVSRTGAPVKPKKSGGGGGGGNGYTPTLPTSAAAIGTATLPAGAGGEEVLVDATGLTLYALDNDYDAVHSTFRCSDTNNCIPTWTPVFTLGAPSAEAASDTMAAKLATLTRTFGTTSVDQVTYNGYPLYTYAGDTGAGQDTGQWRPGFWRDVFPDGSLNGALHP